MWQNEPIINKYINKQKNKWKEREREGERKRKWDSISSNKFKERGKNHKELQGAQEYKKIYLFPMEIWSINNGAGSAILKPGTEQQKVFLRGWEIKVNSHL